MAKHIPFVYRKLDSQLANKVFGDSEVVRMPLQAGETVRRSLPKRSKVWVDAAVDRYHRPDAADVDTAKGMEAFTQITGGDKLGQLSFQETPEIEIVDRFVAGVLEKCCELDADWVSVPQLPVVGNSSRNKINKALASATAKWKAEARFKGALILPGDCDPPESGESQGATRQTQSPGKTVLRSIWGGRLLGCRFKPRRLDRLANFRAEAVQSVNEFPTRNSGRDFRVGSRLVALIGR